MHEYNDIQKEIDQLYKQINENGLEVDSEKMTCPICKMDFDHDQLGDHVLSHDFDIDQISDREGDELDDMQPQDQ